MDTSSITDPALLRVLATAEQTRIHCESMLDFLRTHRQPAGEPSHADALALSKQQKLLLAHLSTLRGRHRAAVYSTRETKALTSAAKSEIDSLHLHLQNLAYEQRHLRGEIQACEEYPHAYAKLALADVDEFRARTEGTDELDEHALMLARIRDEHEQRRRLERERAKLLSRKAELVKANLRQKEELDKLDREVEAWLDGRAKVEKMFEERQKKEDAMTGVEATA